MQHRREYFHRFNTARIAQKALYNSRLLADRTGSLAHRLQLKPRAGLLYPGPTATLLRELPLERRPQQLVVVDGTWHQTKTLVRDIPALQRLPRYQLAPATPSRYRIRRVPNSASLSTLEAIVAALRILEPETNGLDQLLQAFEKMVDAQLAHPGSAGGARFQLRGGRTFKNVPLALANLENIIVAYGEATPGERGTGKRAAGPPVCWVAHRFGDGAGFGCMLIPREPLSEVFLGHAELTRADFAAALSLTEARRRWADFQRPGDVVAVVQPGTAQLFSHISDGHTRCLVLKGVDLESVAEQAMAISPEPDDASPATTGFGRATKRLAGAIQLVRRLHALVKGRSVPAGE